MRMVRFSLWLNVLVLVPVLGGLLVGALWAEDAYGPATPAREILTAVYAAILGASAVLLVRPSTEAAATLLAVQVVYKLLTVVAVGTLAHPVVLSNVVIACVHIVTLRRVSRQRVTT